MPRPQFPVGTIPQTNSAYLVQLSFSATGDVQDVQQVKPGAVALPKVVIDEFRKWRLEPKNQLDKPEATKILAVVRIENAGSDCDVYTCPIPFVAADLYPAFVLIDLNHSSTTPPAPPGFENYDLFLDGGTDVPLDLL
jgi:hypothetical protein